METPSYLRRRWMRAFEGTWVAVERAFNALLTSRYNPLYHLGTLALFLLMVLAVTGVYLTIFYRPGATRAYETVMGISQTTLGLWMRTVHRYASDALMIVIGLHALKMFLSERFAAARWVAWVTGWLLTVLIWAIGVMGYWLVWDQTAQWITEFLIRLFGPSMALTFYGPEMVAKSFAFFVIVLFLHVFLSVLILLGFLLHILRLSRPQWLAPRWLMVQVGVALGLIALLFPVTMEPKADFSRLLTQVPVDWLYLAFLPLDAQWGTLFWIISLGLLGLALALPWLLPDRHAGPARIVEHLCTGCGLGALKCPYQAIELVPRGDESAFKFMATIRPSLCVGCGLCLGTCAVISIDLDAYPTQSLLQDLRRAVEEGRAQKRPVILLATCQRHLALGTLPIPVSSFPQVISQEITVNGRTAVAVLLALPCVGMLNPEWIRPLLMEGHLEGVGVISCPSEDCAFREGPFWLAQNLKYRRNLTARAFYWTESAPGDRKAFQHLIRALLEDEVSATPAPQRIADILAAREGKWPRKAWRPLVAGFAAIALLFWGVRSAVQTTSATTDSAMVRLLMAHAGEIRTLDGTLSESWQTKLPPGVTASQVLGGERYPVRLRIELDGQIVLEKTYEPSGLRKEGQAYAFEHLPLAPGQHRLRISLMDDGQNWEVVFDEVVQVPSGQVVTLVFDDEQGRFALVLPPAR